MATWCWLVEHASEHTPSPWLWSETYRDRGEYDVSAGNSVGENWFTVARIERTATYVGDFQRGKVAGSDPEAFANARLVADAPELLKLLARWAEFGEAVNRMKGMVTKRNTERLNDTCEMLRRHVRIGVAEVDAEGRADQPCLFNPDNPEQVT